MNTKNGITSIHLKWNINEQQDNIQMLGKSQCEGHKNLAYTRPFGFSKVPR